MNRWFKKRFKMNAFGKAGNPVGWRSWFFALASAAVVSGCAGVEDRKDPIQEGQTQGARPQEVTWVAEEPLPGDRVIENELLKSGTLGGGSAGVGAEGGAGKNALVKRTSAPMALPPRARSRSEIGKELRGEKNASGEILVSCSVRLPEDPNEYKEMCSNFRVALLSSSGAVLARERFTPQGALRFSVESLDGASDSKKGEKRSQETYRIRPLVTRTWKVEVHPNREIRPGEKVEVRFIQQLAP